jgi:glucose/arabinose dehydrogenase
MDGLWSLTIDYDDTTISTEKPNLALKTQYYWLPSIAPSGMTFVTSDKYPVEGHLLVGSLKFQYLELVKLNGDKVIDRQR